MTTSVAPPAKPRVLELNQLTIPPELRQIDAWVGWLLMWQKDGWSKEPVNLKTGGLAKSNDPATWVSFKYAIASYRRLGCDGIGLCRTEDLIFIDLDGVLDGVGNLKPYPWAQETLSAISGKAYIERSVMGTGLHAVCYGSLPEGRRQFDEPGMDHTGFAFYETRRDILPSVVRSFQRVGLSLTSPLSLLKFTPRCFLRRRVMAQVQSQCFP